MQEIGSFLSLIDSYIGGSQWFVLLLLGTGFFFTLYLKFPQVRFFGHAIKVVSGKYDHHLDKGDTSHFQSLATALSGTVGPVISPGWHWLFIWADRLLCSGCLFRPFWG